MTKKGKAWKAGGEYPEIFTFRMTKEQKQHLEAFDSQAEILRHLIDVNMRNTG